MAYDYGGLSYLAAVANPSSWGSYGDYSTGAENYQNSPDPVTPDYSTAGGYSSENPTETPTPVWTEDDITKLINNILSKNANQGGLTDFFAELGKANDQFLNNQVIPNAISRVTGLDTELSGVGAQLATDRTSLSALGKNIGRLSGDISGLETSLGQLGTTYQNMSQGNDPRFAAYKKSVLDELDYQQKENLRETGDYFAGLGFRGSSAALNAANKVREGYGRRRSSALAEIGLNELTRQDQALKDYQNTISARSGLINQKSSIYGQQTGLVGQQSAISQAIQNVISGRSALSQLAAGLENNRLENVTAGLENLTIGERLAIARLAAENAGKD